MRGFAPLLTSALLGVLLLGSACSSIRPLRSTRDGWLDGPLVGRQRSSLREDRNRAERAPASSEEIQKIAEASLRWPLKQVRVTSQYGKRGGDFHEGIDLKAASGTSIFAAQAGQVIYAGSQIRGYGRMVVVRHAEGLSTIYAHNSKLRVIRGQRVKQGQLIALSGNTGHSSGPHLHFEIRSGVKALDPAQIMRETALARARTGEDRKLVSVTPKSTRLASNAPDARTGLKTKRSGKSTSRKKWVKKRIRRVEKRKAGDLA